MSDPYAAAIITFLDRGSGKTVTQYAYPIIEIKLVNFKGETTRIFTVGEDGAWQEEEEPL
jgi:hypothetical protein